MTHASAFQPQPPDPTTDLGAFVAELTRLVLDEADADRAQTHGLWVRPLGERVAAGHAIADLRIVARESGGWLTLVCARNESRFREGDVLCLNRGSPFFTPNLLVTLEIDEETELVVSCDDPAFALQDFEALPDGWVLDEGYLDFSGPALDAIQQAADTAAGRGRVLPLLAGQTRPGVDPDRFERALARAEAWGLNMLQAEALAMAYAAEPAYLIQGPPGTGKTRVLARLAQLLAEDGERVLISAFTHRAINQALNTLARLTLAEAAPVTFAKIGRQSRIDDLVGVESYERFGASPLADLSGGYIIGATPFATRTNRLSGVEFDTVIFDEASQITLPLAVMGMLVGKRFIFVGDQRQLSPVLATRHGDTLLHGSVFGALVDRGFDTMLEITYRLNAALTAWPSAQFYDNRLVPAPDAADRRIVYDPPPARLAGILDADEPLVFVDLAHQNATTHSDIEASLAADLVVTLLASGLSPSEIGVVTPYRAQARAIRKLLRAALPDARALWRAVVVDTVERMQGQEREVVIVSLTTSNPTFATNLADFLFQPERLNVAITRPRSKLIILGSRRLLDAAPGDPTHQAWVAQLADLLVSCTHRVVQYLGGA